MQLRVPRNGLCIILLQRGYTIILFYREKKAYINRGSTFDQGFMYIACYVTYNINNRTRSPSNEFFKESEGYNKIRNIF